MSHIQRLHNVLNTWKGLRYIGLFMRRQINAAVLVLWSEIPKLETFLETIHHNHTTLILYVIDNRTPMKRVDNCVYVETGFGLKCEQYEDVIYPINLLRNLAIETTSTEYYVNMDADIIPSRRSRCYVSWKPICIRRYVRLISLRIPQ